MKKKILAFGMVLLALSVAAYGIFDKGETQTQAKPAVENSLEVEEEIAFTSLQKFKTVEPEFLLDLSSRFYMTKSKTELQELKSFQGFFGDFELRDYLDNISLVMFDENMQDSKIVKGLSMECTPEQLEFLQNLNYSDNFRIDAYFRKKGENNGSDQWDHWTPHISVVPEKQAVYSLGGEAFMDYVKSSSKSYTAGLKDEDLKGGKLAFTISKNGSIVNAALESSCGFEDVDAQMLKLISNAPGIWIPAENQNGDKVEQEFYLSFGRMGC